MHATPRTLDFSLIQEPENEQEDTRPKDAKGKLLTGKQIRARARRKARRLEIMTPEELHHLYKKPIEDWDIDELAHGRPKNAAGHFKGPNPKWITAQMHEESMNRFTAIVKTHMRATTVDALALLTNLINDDSVDDKGKYLVPPSVKLEASKFLIEHVVGKPTQRIENDVSIKLQAILGQVMVNPSELQPQYRSAHYPGITMNMGMDDETEFKPSE